MKHKSADFDQIKMTEHERYICFISLVYVIVCVIAKDTLLHIRIRNWIGIEIKHVSVDKRMKYTHNE